MSTVGILNSALNALPAILALIHAEHAKANPDAAPLTDAQVIAALHDAVASVVAKGDAWKLAHPQNGDVSGPVPAGSIGD